MSHQHMSNASGLLRQRRVFRVSAMPNLPRPFKVIDWRQKALDYDALAFDFNARGENLPLIWMDETRPNIDQSTFGLFSYMGDPRMGPHAGKPDAHEGVTALGSVLGSSLVGIDKSRQNGYNFVKMCRSYFNRESGMNIFGNWPRMAENGSFWYDLYPNILFFCLTDMYPFEERMPELMWVCSQQFNSAVRELRDNYWHTAFDFKNMKPVDNGVWVEPHAAAGFAWLQYAAHRRFGQTRFLRAAESALRFLHNEKRNPTYEALLPWGALTAARMNAEHGHHFDLHKILNWCFCDSSDAREGWGVIVGNWNGYDVSGLAGSTIDFYGYAFAMNTFNLAMPLLPLVRYAPRYARAIGKWMLNAANAARLFYPNELPAANQTCAHLRRETRNAIAYEGLANRHSGASPRAMGDPLMHGWANTDFCLYGSALCGVFGSTIQRTNQEHILQLDCLKTDFFSDKAYPTYLYFNPHDTDRTVSITVGDSEVDLFNAVTKHFLRTGVRGETSFTLPANTAAVVVLCPSAGNWTRDGRRLLVNGVTVDYGLGMQD